MSHHSHHSNHPHHTPHPPHLDHKSWELLRLIAKDHTHPHRSPGHHPATHHILPSLQPIHTPDKSIPTSVSKELHEPSLTSHIAHLKSHPKNVHQGLGSTQGCSFEYCSSIGYGEGVNRVDCGNGQYGCQDSKTKTMLCCGDACCQGACKYLPAHTGLCSKQSTCEDGTRIECMNDHPYGPPSSCCGFVPHTQFYKCYSDDFKQTCPQIDPTWQHGSYCPAETVGCMIKEGVEDGYVCCGVADAPPPTSTVPHCSSQTCPSGTKPCSGNLTDKTRKESFVKACCTGNTENGVIGGKPVCVLSSEETLPVCPSIASCGSGTSPCVVEVPADAEGTKIKVNGCCKGGDASSPTCIRPKACWPKDVPSFITCERMGGSTSTFRGAHACIQPGKDGEPASLLCTGVSNEAMKIGCSNSECQGPHYTYPEDWKGYPTFMKYCARDMPTVYRDFCKDIPKPCGPPVSDPCSIYGNNAFLAHVGGTLGQSDVEFACVSTDDRYQHYTFYCDGLDMAEKCQDSMPGFCSCQYASCPSSMPRNGPCTDLYGKTSKGCVCSGDIHNPTNSVACCGFEFGGQDDPKCN